MNAIQRIAACSSLLLLGLTSTSSFAGGDPAAGQKKAQACIACHGQGGLSTSPTYPILAGQQEDYLVQALTDYQKGNRKNPIMAGMASPLKKQDIADLAAYFAKQTSPLAVKR
ncbi:MULTISPECIES: c-type cytochrome [Leeia]|uniref:Cytochrome c n=1 Tax=Leeia aquatica TaxID=2725557 RepID=A0A847S915_9NEIS|nr:cytochrome c [Leeia aquatica]NLR74086.1 cytochrome c [Leeia aquatica]